jgi:hypothetical protein
VQAQPTQTEAPEEEVTIVDDLLSIPSQFPPAQCLPSTTPVISLAISGIRLFPQKMAGSEKTIGRPRHHATPPLCPSTMLETPSADLAWWSCRALICPAVFIETPAPLRRDFSFGGPRRGGHKQREPWPLAMTGPPAVINNRAYYWPINRMCGPRGAAVWEATQGPGRSSPMGGTDKELMKWRPSPWRGRVARPWPRINNSSPAVAFNHLP